MRSTSITLIILLFLAAPAYAQSDRGTITGTITDPTQALLPGVSIRAVNNQTGATYQTISTETGNYALPQLVAGVYDLTIELPGFKKYVRQGVTVQVAQTLRIDAALEIGITTQEVTVILDAPLLRTEGGELSQNVTASRLSELPILGIGTAGAGSSGIRNPLAVTRLIPGSYFQPNTNVRVNGAPVNSQSIRVEGQDASNMMIPFAQAQTQPSVDAIQEVSIQTSNYAAEYGATTGGVFNYTMKSGGNAYHGSVFDYAANEALNSGRSYTNTGRNPRERQRRHNYGFSVGGPVNLGVYDGHNKTFFFFNFEQFREKVTANTQQFTVPTLRYRNGDFGEALTGRQLGVDALNRPIMEGTIYDPNTMRVVNGQVVREPFPDNVIPKDRWDPVAAKIQELIPLPSRDGVVNNFLPSYPSQRITSIPALKIDHQFSSTRKLSFYWSRTATASQYSPQFGGSDGLPTPITASRGTFIESHVERLNYDQSLSPTMLLHVGVGYQHNDFKDNAPTLDFDAERELGLKGTTLNRLFPQIYGLGGAGLNPAPPDPPNPVANRGGMKDMGPGPQSRTLMIKPTISASITSVKNNHTYKAGGEYRLDGYPTANYVRTAGQLVFSPNQTALPYLQSATIQGGTIGFPYASFLLGLVEQGNIASPVNYRLGKQQWAFFGQDTWKITRTFTLDYGLRWDYFTYLKEQHGRLPNFAPDLPNPKVGGLPGASIFEGEGPGRCGCQFGKNYPWAFGPRIGAAWQMTSRFVLRGGWGITYGGTSNERSNGAGSSNPFTAPAFGDWAMRLRDGIPLTGAQVSWPKYDAGIFPVLPNQIADYGSNVIDPNSGRPSRIMQWSIGIQNEFFRNFVVEASYVANRGVWLQANDLVNINALTPERLAAFGLNINDAADQQLLRSPLNSTLAAQRGFNRLPYATFPTGQTVAQSLRPFPQFTNINVLNAPVGNSWYDALQVRATKRLSHGIDFTSNFSWQKELTIGAENQNGTGQQGANFPAVNDAFNRNQNKQISSFSRPFTFTLGLNYQLPVLDTNRFVSWALRDWQFGMLMAYSSGLPIRVPLAQNNLNQLLFRGTPEPGTRAPAAGTNANRVEGEPLFLKDLNCHCFDPNKEFVLNPRAWVDPPAGQFGFSPPYYNDYRQQRRPQESLSIGRRFQVKERYNLQVRVEWSNIFNRAYLNNPDSTNARATQTTNAAGNTVSGFGRINTATDFSNFLPRQGTIVARFTF